jgi:hypothetical protein
MNVSRDLIPMALLALATLVAVGAIVLLGELLRRGILAMLAAILPAPAAVAAPDDGGPEPRASGTERTAAHLDPGA